MAGEKPADIEPEKLAEEIAGRCVDLLRTRPWPDRLQALSDMHDQLRQDFKDFDVFCTVFPLFVSTLIEQLGEEEVNSLEQAHIYANSSAALHRDAAGRWLKGHG